LTAAFRNEPELFAAVEKIRPNDPLVPLTRGREMALQSKWEEAKKAYAAAVQSLPAGAEWFDYAALCVICNDRKAYQEHCAWMAKQEGQPVNEFVGHYYARTAGLVADADKDWSPAVKWAQTAVDKQPGAAAYLHAAGLVYCRDNQLDKARERLEASLKLRWESQILNNLALGMVECKLGNEEAAKKQLDLAHRWQQAIEKGKTNSYANVILSDWLEFNALLPELEAQLAKGQGDGKPAREP
jgi:predicted Zn-dependent protease